MSQVQKKGNEKFHESNAIYCTTPLASLLAMWVFAEITLDTKSHKLFKTQLSKDFFFFYDLLITPFE